ncbi:hypothetical protein L0F63_006589, partial [Massospora cicadina]
LILNAAVGLLVLRRRRICWNSGHKLTLALATSDLLGGVAVLVRVVTICLPEAECGALQKILDLLVTLPYLQSNIILALLGLDRYLTAAGLSGVSWKALVLVAATEVSCFGTALHYDISLSLFSFCPLETQIVPGVAFLTLASSILLLTWSYLRIIFLWRTTRQRVRDAISSQHFIGFEIGKDGNRCPMIRVYWKAGLMVFAYLFFTSPVLVALAKMALSSITEEIYLVYTCCIISLQLFNPTMDLMLHSHIQHELTAYFLPPKPLTL